MYIHIYIYIYIYMCLTPYSVVLSLKGPQGFRSLGCSAAGFWPLFGV